MILTAILQQFYNLIDTAVAGQKLGNIELTAIGVSSSLVFLYIAISIGFSMGCSIVISQYFGAKHYTHMKTSVYTAFAATIVIAVIITVLGNIYIEDLLSLLKATPEVYDDARQYLEIFQYSLIFTFIYNTAAFSLNAIGDSRSPLVFLIISVILNVFLDLYFAVTLKLGVAGIAWATLLCQAISCVLALIVLFKKISKMYSKEKPQLFRLKTLGVMLKVAVPSVLQQSAVGLGMLLVQRLVNGYSLAVTTGYYAAIKIDGMAIAPLVNIGNAVSTFVAQNIGAGKYERINKGYKAGFILDIAICVLMAIVIFIFAPDFLTFFIKKSETEAIAIGASYLYVVGAFYIVLAFMNTTSGVLRGAGAMNLFLITTLINLASRVIIAYTLTPLWGYKGIWWSMVFSWFISATIALLFYKFANWRKVKLME